MPDLASLLAESEAGGGGGKRVVYLPIGQFAGPRVSATSTARAEPAAAMQVPMPVPLATTTAPTHAVLPTNVTPPLAPAVPGADAGADERRIDGSGTGAAAGAENDARARFNRAVEALRPRGLDPRLRPGSIAALRTDHERAALRAYARIRALNDSIMAEIAAGRRATDWTWTDEQGRRWGISPGMLHLGGITIPLPISTAPSREQRELLLEWQEIQAQAERGAIDDTFDDRVEAIRERRDAERQEP